MSRFKRLVIEIHRHSLWQIVAIYLGGAWLAYEIIQGITEGRGLPEWLPALALVLLVIGLPLVVATAFVSDGVGGEDEAAVPPSPDAEAAADRAEAAARRRSVGRRRILNWRNAGLSFLAALALWGIVVTAWLMLGLGRVPAVVWRPSVAALPFVNRSGVVQDEYFTDGIHDEILTQLSKISALSVRGRSSVMQYRESPKNLRQIGRELDARYLLEGGVLRAGQTVRINVQLIDAEKDEHLWAETYDRHLSIENLLAIQTEVARRIADALEARLTRDEENRLSSTPTQDLRAYDDYLRGRYFWHRRSIAAFDSAVQYFNRAIILDPDYARAYAALAETYVLLPEYGGPPIAEMLPLAKAATARAQSLDPELAEAYTASGYVKMVFEWDHEGAEGDFLKAIELDPDYATAHQWYAELLGASRRWDEAVAEAQRAAALDPLSPAANVVLGVILTYSGRLADAIPMYERALRLVPDWVVAMSDLAEAHVLNGDYATAARLYDRLARLTGGNPQTYRAFLAALSDPALVPAAVEALKAGIVYGNTGKSAYIAHVGDVDEALAALEEEYEARSPRLPWANANPMYDGLRSDPRFQDLLRRMNFPD